jgi:hemoglobin/transferrin/lactoferrin receptor protein
MIRQISIFVSLLSFVLVAFPNTLLTATISGKIIDESGAGVIGAAISLKPSGSYTLSDSTGRFVLPDISVGIYALSLDRVGFKSISDITVEVVDDDTVRLSDIVLYQEIVELPAMTVTATRSARSVEDVSQKMSVVSSRQIADRGAKTPADALREETGIFVQKTNQGGGNAIIRGHSASKVLLMVDGVRLNNSTYRAGNHQYLATVSPELIDQIEVVHGPTSTQYGSDAFGGTIHLRSATPSYSANGTDVSGKLLSQLSSADGERSSSLQLSISGRNAAFSARGGYKHIGDIQQGNHFGYGLSVLADGDNLQNNNGYIARDFDSKAVVAVGSRTQLTGAVQLSRMPRVPRYDKFAYENFYRWDYTGQNRDLIYLTFDRDVGGKLFRSSRLTLSHQKQTEGRETQATSTDPMTDEHDNTTTLGVVSEFHLKVESHQVLVGAEYYADKVRSSRTEINGASASVTVFNRGRYPDKSLYRSLGAFIQDEWQAGARLRLTVGLRLSVLRATMPFPDDTSLPTNLGTVRQSYSAITASAGVLFKLSPTLSLTSNVGQAFHAPNLNDLSRLGESKGLTFEVPSPELSPERMNSLDIGCKLNSPVWQASGSLFCNWVDGLIESADALYDGSPTITKGSVVYQVKAKANIGTARIYGFESSVSRRITESIRLRAGLAYTRGVNTTADEPVGSIPPLFGLAGIQYESRKVVAEIWSRFASAQRRLSSDDRDDPRIPAEGTPGWYTMNLRASVRAAEWMRLRVAVENLFDRLYREHGSGVNAAGRNVIGSLEFAF